ncbi:MAG TPA: GrpB family protein [Actinomycetota bacterium]
MEVRQGGDRRAGDRPYRPLVAVVGYHLDGTRVARWPHGGYGVPLPYVERLRAAGARTAIVAPGETGDPEELLEPFDGLVLVGGGDVDPSRYGGERTDHVYGVEPDRDETELELLLAADRLRMPSLCICRGMQLMNVAFGGTLVPHLPAVDGMLEHGVPVADTQTVHDVKVAPESLLMATTRADVLRCSSHHHQGVDRLGEGLVATGWSDDGLVEAIELPPVDEDDWTRWVVGVQWHPEDTARDDPAQQALFDGLVRLAEVRGTRAAGGRAGRSRPFEVVDPDPRWPARFDEEAARIRGALGDVALRIEHVGSTAVPGLPAKPVIDVQVSVASLSPRERWRDPLVAAGYRYVLDPTAIDRELLVREAPDGTRLANVHLTLAGSDWERRHLAFRDHLRATPEDRDAYGRLKRDLAARHHRDLHTYSEAKTAFIRDVERRSLVRRD